MSQRRSRDVRHHDVYDAGARGTQGVQERTYTADTRLPSYSQAAQSGTPVYQQRYSGSRATPVYQRTDSWHGTTLHGNTRQQQQQQAGLYAHSLRNTSYWM